MLSLLSSVLVIVAVFFLYILEVVRRQTRRWQLLSKFPGDAPLPFIGNGLALGFDSDEATLKLMHMWKKHGKTNFRVTIGLDHWIMLNEPKDLEILFSNSTELFKVTKRNVSMKPFFGNSLGSLEGERWRMERKLMTSGFSHKILESQLELMDDYLGRLGDRLSQYDGQIVDFYIHFKPFFFDIGCKALTGVEYNFIDQNDAHPYIMNSNKLVEIVTKNYFSYFSLWGYVHTFYKFSSMAKAEERIVKTIREMSAKLISDRRKTLNSQMKSDLSEELPEVKCVLDILLLNKSSDEEPISEDVINDEISFMCFTTMHLLSLTVSHALYCIAKHPDVQNKLFEEQKHVLNAIGISSKLTTKDYNKVTYLDAVLKETMRLITPVTLMGRYLQDDLVLTDGRVIPAATNVFVHCQGLSQNDKIYHDPEKFIPDRFLDKNLHNYAFLPFGSGRRNCLGYRFAWVAMKATLWNVLCQFEFSVTPQSEPQFVYRILTESRNGIKLHMKTRNLESGH